MNFRNWFAREQQIGLTPDGTRYILAAEGNKVSRPFHYRWLLPRLLGVMPQAWIRTTDAFALLLGPAVYFYAAARGHGGWKGIFAAGLAVGCSGIVAFNRRWPVLVDLPALVITILSAACWYEHWYVPAVALVLVAASIKESSPVFAAAFAWSPWLLFGLLAPLVRHFQRREEVPADLAQMGYDGVGRPIVTGSAPDWRLRDVVRGAFDYRKAYPLAVYVLPWGVLLLGFGHISWQLATVLALAYGQLVIATDCVRLYQWAVPTLAVAAAGAVDARWYLLLLLLHWSNPFTGSVA